MTADARRMVATMVATPDRDAIYALLAQVPDPEIPVLSITDLGVVREIDIDGSHVTVGITPTYSACPATEVIEASVREHLQKHGYDAEVQRLLSPPWTTDWISDEGREKLKRYGITPPGGRGLPVACPRCDSTDTTKVSEFGSTPCKAAYKCVACLEPFDYFKCL